MDYRQLLKANEGVDEEGRFIYLLPVDAVSVLRSVGNYEYEIMGEHIHSYAVDLKVVINRKINFNEIKDVYFQLLKFWTAKKIAEVYPQFENKLEYIYAQMQEEENKIAMLEVKGFNYLERGTAFSRK